VMMSTTTAVAATANPTVTKAATNVTTAEK
jgi:hypothetical protein